MYLMHRDVKVLDFDLDENRFDVLAPEFMPYELRGAFKAVTPDMSEAAKINALMNNRDVFTHFLAGRMLALDRKNAKKILNACHFSQDQTDYTKAKIAIACRAVSMTDCYWIDNGSGRTWEDVDVRHCKLNQIVANIALTGSSLTVTGEPHSPELTGQGAYAKAWGRDENGGAYLMKAPTPGGMEERIEVSVSNILDHFNVDHVRYEDWSFEGKPVSKCYNMATDDLSIVSAEGFAAYCRRIGKNFMDEALAIDAESIYKMCVVDYLVSNSDRHGKNWGFFMDNNTGEIISCHPLFDHNNAFDAGDMAASDGGESLIFPGQTKRDVARYAIKKCTLECRGVVSREVFVTEEMYDSFCTRAVELGIYEKCRNFPAAGHDK